MRREFAHLRDNDPGECGSGRLDGIDFDSRHRQLPDQARRIERRIDQLA
jgi:hypothetical protein